MSPARILSLLVVAVLGPTAATAQRAAPSPAAALLDRAVAAMGGEAALRAVGTVRLDIMTMWQRTWFGDHPYADQPSYERNVELRDYRQRRWRNTRQFFGGGPASVVVVVADTVAAVHVTGPTGTRSTPLNVAYVDERRELYAFAPERVALLAREAPDLRLLPDTAVEGVPHGRVSATIDRFPAVVFLRRSDGLPAMVRFEADETNDMGLAPWGVQQVEFWYSNWQATPAGVLLPRQRDVRRVGRPYKRMTVLAATVNPPAPADSFAIADSLVTGFFATQNRPMWDRPLDSARVVQGTFASFGPFTGAGGAVRIGGRWVLLEMGQAPAMAERLAAWLERAEAGAPLGAAIATRPATGSGGVRWLAERKVPLVVAPGAEPFVRRMLARSWPANALVADRPRWVRVGSDSLWVEPIAVPDAPGTLAVYSPTLRWLYSAAAGSPLFQPAQDALVARLEARGLPVESIGSARAIMTPLAPKATGGR